MPQINKRRIVVYSDQTMTLFSILCENGQKDDVIKIRNRCQRIAPNPTKEGSLYLPGNPPLYKALIKGHELEWLSFPAGFRILYAFDETVLYVARVEQISDTRL